MLYSDCQTEDVFTLVNLHCCIQDHYSAYSLMVYRWQSKLYGVLVEHHHYTSCLAVHRRRTGCGAVLTKRRYCTNPAPITSQDTLILSHSFNLRLAQTLFIFPFFLMLYQFGIVYHTPLFHYLILVCLRKALLNITYLYNLGTLYY